VWRMSSPPDRSGRLALFNSSLSALQLVSVCPQCPLGGANASVSEVQVSSDSARQIILTSVGASIFDFSAQSVAPATVVFDACVATPNSGAALPSNVVVLPNPQCAVPALGCAALPAPCQNGATCVATSASTYNCLCTTYWTGPTCATWIDPCSVQQCFFGTTCVSTALSSSYTCVCNSTQCSGTPSSPVAPTLYSLTPSASPAIGGVYMTLITQGFTGAVTLQFARHPVSSAVATSALNLTAPIAVNVSVDASAPRSSRQLKLSFVTPSFATPRSAYRYELREWLTLVADCCAALSARTDERNECWLHVLLTQL
jgi:hypothetical protein